VRCAMVRRSTPIKLIDNRERSVVVVSREAAGFVLCGIEIQSTNFMIPDRLMMVQQWVL